MEQQRCGGHCAAGIGHQASGSDDGAHGGADFRFGDGDDAIDKGLDVGEVALANGLRAQAIGDCAAGQFRGQVTIEPVRKLSAVSPASSGSTP